MIKYWFTRKITLYEILLGNFVGFLSYVFIAFFNISNEENYNWEVSLIFSKGHVIDIIALLAFWLWFVAIAFWITSIIFRIIRIITK